MLVACRQSGGATGPNAMIRQLVAALAAASALQAAEAGVISHSVSFSLADAYQGAATGVFSATFSDSARLVVPRFNAANGTLTGVSIAVDSTARTAMRGSARDDREESDYIYIPPFFINDRNDTSLSASLSASLRLLMNDPAPVAALGLTGLAGDCAIRRELGLIDNEVVSCSVDESGSRGLGLALDLSAVPLSAFIGADALDLFVLMEGTLRGVCDHDDEGDQCRFDEAGVDWIGSLRVSYTYNSQLTGGGPGLPGGGGDPPQGVPEPGTGLLALGALAMLVRSRRHRC